MSSRLPAKVPMAAAWLAPLFLAASAAAVDVRQPETGALFHADLVRAYAQCVAPNTVARNGAAACDTPATSVCLLSNGRLEATPPLFDADPTIPTATFGVSTHGPQVCRTGEPITFSVGIRTTTDASAIGPDGGELACSSQHCTFPDTLVTEQSQFFSLFAGAHGDLDPNYEIFGLTIDGPDGLPVAGFGMEEGGLATFITNLTIPYAPCSAPETGGACNLVSPNAGCDFESGAIEWPRLDELGAPFAHVVLRDVAGASPLCTAGPYALEATLRVTGRVCGTPDRAARCTVVDQTVSAPLTPNSRRTIDETVRLPLGKLGIYDNSQIDNVGVLSVRVIDPTGATVAVPGVTGVRSLIAPHVGLKGDRLRVRATIPVNQFAPLIDPTLAGGATVTLSDRDGVFYAVTIPELRWQDQSPLGSRWTYDDPGGVLGGVYQASLKRVGKADAATGYKLDLRAAGVDLSGADLPSITLKVAVARPDVIGGGDPQIHRAQRNCTGVFKGPKLDCK